jgi:ABC-type uncharacterized transport system substrate-binding protein
LTERRLTLRSTGPAGHITSFFVRQMWTIIDKIIKGAKAGELPVQTVVRYDLVVNLKTASEISATIPPAVLKRADRVIQ